MLVANRPFFQMLQSKIRYNAPVKSYTYNESAPFFASKFLKTQKNGGSLRFHIFQDKAIPGHVPLRRSLGMCIRICIRFSFGDLDHVVTTPIFHEIFIIFLRNRIFLSSFFATKEALWLKFLNILPKGNLLSFQKIYLKSRLSCSIIEIIVLVSEAFLLSDILKNTKTGAGFAGSRTV